MQNTVTKEELNHAREQAESARYARCIKASKKVQVLRDLLQVFTVR